MKQINGYELVVGLEVHVELKTKTKIFCSCRTDFGAPPNTQCCPICMGLPGAMPTLNARAVEYAARAGLALGCTVNRISKFDRKNYFYPDLPKGYQISQYDVPICENGELYIDTAEGEKRVGITRIHLEEDAGKLIHDGNDTLIDHNRCGVPLIEIVTEPDIRSSDEAKEFLKKLRSVLLYTGISDCRMNEGSMRCDVNLSVRRLGDTSLGVRTEMKNLNSFAFTAKAIEYEYARQVALIESGGKVEQQTRRFDSSTGETYSMRTKESAADYRFFPEPDLPLCVISEDSLSEIRASIPELPDARRKRYVNELSVSAPNASVLVGDRALADLFEAAARHTRHTRVLANIMVTELLSLTDMSGGEQFSCSVEPIRLASLASLLGEGIVSSTVAKKLLSEMLTDGIDPEVAVRERGLSRISSEEELLPIVRKAIEDSPRAVADVLCGKRSAAKAIIGRVMALTSGRADPSVASAMIEREINVKS